MVTQAAKRRPGLSRGPVRMIAQADPGQFPPRQSAISWRMRGSGSRRAISSRIDCRSCSSLLARFSFRSDRHDAGSCALRG